MDMGGTGVQVNSLMYYNVSYAIYLDTKISGIKFVKLYMVHQNFALHLKYPQRSKRKIDVPYCHH